MHTEGLIFTIGHSLRKSQFHSNTVLPELDPTFFNSPKLTMATLHASKAACQLLPSRHAVAKPVRPFAVKPVYKTVSRSPIAVNVKAMASAANFSAPAPEKPQQSWVQTVIVGLARAAAFLSIAAAVVSDL